MLWICLLATVGSVCTLSLDTLTQAPWWTSLVVTAWFLGAFVATVLFHSIRAGWRSKVRVAPQEAAIGRLRR